MTRKDYVKFAEALRNFRQEHGFEDNADVHAEAFENICVSIFADDNQRFDAERFRAASK